MRLLKLYDWETLINFGQCEGQTVKEVFEKSPSYISWCFQNIKWFCITNEIFESLPVVISLRESNEDENLLKILTDKYILKTQCKLIDINHEIQGYPDDYLEEENDDEYYEKDQYDYDRDSFDALTDGQYGSYDDWKENGGDFDNLRDGLGH